MEREVPVKFDTDYLRERRRVRSPWAGWTPGTEIEVEMAGESGSPRWVPARIERWVGQTLMVTRIVRRSSPSTEQR